MTNPDLFSAVHQLLLDHFNAEELKTLCAGLVVDYDDLPASGRSGKARELIGHLERRGRLPELRTAVSQQRPQAVWPGAGSAASAPSAAPVPRRWQLSQADFDRLAGLLATMPEYRSVSGRVDFLDDVFAGSPRKADVLGSLNLDGAPRGVAVRTITRLIQFGQNEPGQETLAVLINKLLSYVGGGPDADFLRGLFDRYPLHGQPTSTRGLDDWRGRESPQDVREKIIGENTLRDVRMLELALEAARAVVRIRADDGLGSGFLVAPGLVMTNHHVIDSAAAAQPCAFQFNYQLDRDLRPAPIVTARAAPDGLFYTNADLDFTVVAIQEAPDDVAPLTLARLRQKRDDRVNIIQHPGGHYKKISWQNNFVAFADARELQYLTTTEPGSSGSPVFNNDFVVVGIHHSGGDLPEPDSNRRYLRNGGSSMIAVLDDLQAHAPQIYQRLRIQ